MMNKYFQGITNQAELRKAFIRLLKKYHPDNGGDAEICKQINAEYERLLKSMPAGGAATEEKQSEADKQAAADLDREIRKALEKIIHIDGINIEVVGTWIWVDGNTYPVRELLKSLGYKWSKARKKWHFTPYGEGTYYKGKRKSFDSLRKIYGSSRVSSDPAFLLT